MTSKNTFKIAVLVATFLFIASFWSASVANAACPTPLPDDYPEIPYEGPFRVDLVLPSGCHVIYEYCYRKTYFYDFYIDIYAIYGYGTDPTICDDYLDPSTLQLNMIALLKICRDNLILVVNPWQESLDLPPCIPNPNSENWSSKFFRQSHASCFGQWYWDLLERKWKKYFCPNDTVCWEVVQYCWYWVTNSQGEQELKLNDNVYTFFHEPNCGMPMPGSCYSVCE